MTKKSQQEIMGLALVIIFIIIAILVIAKLSPNQKFSYKKEYEQSVLASSMIDTLLATTSTCNGLPFAQILQDCGRNNANKCNGENSCAYFEQEAMEIFGNTLDSWQIDYEFSVFYDEESPIIKFGKTCVNKKSELFPMPTGAGILSVKLDICR